MTNETINVPELRFPEFEGEWDEKRLGESINVQSGRDYKHLDDGDYPVYGTGGYMCSVSDYLYKKDAVGIGRKGTINKPYLLKGPFWTVDTLFYCIPKDNEDVKFILNLFRTINWKIFDESTGVPSLSKLTINRISKYFPKFEEQQKIGDFFSKLDCQIELEEKKLALLEEQKKGYMQKIFSQELRFKDENGDDYPSWEELLISNIGRVVTGNTPSKKVKEYWGTGDYTWVTPTDISNKKEISTSNYKLSQKGFEKARKLPKDTLLITCIASIGKNAILKKEGSCNQQINAVIPSNDFDVDYLYYAFENVSKLMKRIAGKTATQIVNKNVFENLTVEIPTVFEQQKIAKFLSSYDKIIEKQSNKINFLKEQRQSLLQKMFI